MAEKKGIKRDPPTRSQQNVELPEAELDGDKRSVTEKASAKEGVSLAEAQELVRQSHEATLGVIRSVTAPIGLGPLGAVAAEEADITNELAVGGPAFGAFVKAVGLAVAEAQQKLDETLVTTAKALSDAKINVIAIFEQQLKDSDGMMDEGKIHMQQLPLINYLMPTAYQWTRVYLEADMKVQEFNGANGFNIKGQSTSASVGFSTNVGVMGASVGLSASAATSNYQQGGDTSFSQDQAAGSLHMEATLEPRADIQLPRPFILQKGPRLKLTVKSREDIPGPPVSGSTTATVIGRKIRLTAELRDKANNLLGGKLLECKISEPLLNYTKNPNDGMTGATSGQLEIEITREGGAFDEKKPPQAVTVNVWFGMVNEQVVINI